MRSSLSERLDTYYPPLHIAETYWKGSILAESVEDKTLLDIVEIVKTIHSGKSFRYLTKVDNHRKDEFITKAELSIRRRYYTYICQEDNMALTFRGRTFQFSLFEQQAIEQAREYGALMGIRYKDMPFEEPIINPYQ